jgi:hypothetical protein
MNALARSVVAAACLLAGCAGTIASSSTSSRLRVDGDVTARTLSVEDVESLGLRDVAWTRNGESLAFQAVPLESVLRCVGVEPGDMNAAKPADKRPGWKLAVVATATDGFQAIFSVAEVFHDMGRTEAYVATREKGNRLDDSSGPFRLIVPTDEEGSRSVRNLERLTVLDLRKVLLPPSGTR